MLTNLGSAALEGDDLEMYLQSLASMSQTYRYFSLVEKNRVVIAIRTEKKSDEKNPCNIYVQ